MSGDRTSPASIEIDWPVFIAAGQIGTDRWMRHDHVTHRAYRPASSPTTAVDAMNTSHPIFGELVTSNRLIRGGRWVFRGTIVPLDDVFADFVSGLNLHEIWEKHGALDRRDLEAVATQALGEHVHALRKVSHGFAGSSNGHGRRSARRTAA